MIVLLIYWIGVFSILFWFCGSSFQTAAEYLLASHSCTWPVLTAALFSAGTSSEHFLGLATEASQFGPKILIFEIHTAIQIIILGIFVGPILRNANISTTGEFLEIHYSRNARTLYAVYTFILYIFMKIGVTLYAVAQIYKKLFDVSEMTCSAFNIVLPMIFAIFAGSRAIFFSECWHTIFILFGAGYFLQRLISDQKEFFHVPESSSNELPLSALLMGAPITSAWAWNFDQVSAQCVFSSASNADTKYGCILAAICRVTCALVLAAPGFFTMGISYEELITKQSVGAQSCIVAAISAAAISSLAGIFNATTTIFVYDIYKPLNPEAKDETLITRARQFNFAIGLISLLTLPIIAQFGGHLYVYINEVLSHICPPFVAMFVCALISPRNLQALAPVVYTFGPLIGIVRFALSISGLEMMHSLYYAFACFFSCCFILIIGSRRCSMSSRKELEGQLSSSEEQLLNSIENILVESYINNDD